MHTCRLEWELTGQWFSWGHEGEDLSAKKAPLPQTFFKKRFYLFIHARDRDLGRGRSRLPVGSLMQDSVSGPWDHDLNQRQMLKH